MVYAKNGKQRTRHTMNVLTVGSATQDIFIHYNDPESLIMKSARGTRSYLLLEKGAKIDVQAVSYSTGGGATNSAISFKRLGCTVATLIKVGIGKAGHFVTDELQHQGVDISYVIHDKDVGTGLSYIIPSFEGDRTIFAYRGANAHLHETDIPTTLFKTLDAIYLTSLNGESAKLLLPLVHHAQKNNCLVAINPGNRQLQADCNELISALKHIDIFIVNSQEAKTFMASLAPHMSPQELERNIKSPVKFEDLPSLIQSLIYIENINFNLKDFCKEVMSRGPSIVVVTNGDEGVYVAHGKTLYFSPSLPANVVDTVGAGDAFGSCFTAQILQGKTVEQALIRGVVNASSVISFEDAKTGLLTSSELENRTKKIKKGLIKQFRL